MRENTRTAIVFPGQGSLTDGMRDQVERRRPDLLELAADAVGEDPFARLGEDTRFDQPAIFCASLAGFEALGRPEPDFFAGHSLGEVAALVAAGALAEADGVALVAERGRLMSEAGAGAGGGMLAVRAARADAQPLAGRHGLVVANDNSPEQVVLSGPGDGIATAEHEARELGMRAKRLAVAGGFHSPAMEPALEPFRAALDEIDFAPPEVPVFSCVTAEPFDDPRRRLAEALVSPVRWLEVMRGLQAAGVVQIVEAGPGRVLTGLVRRSLDGVEAEAPGDTLEVARA
jgi:malonyl CoA-acyl carrier protein transacylase